MPSVAASRPITFVSPQHTNPSGRIPDTSALITLPVDVTRRFGMKLRELRKQRGLTQLRMAVYFGIDRSFISDVERGRKSISLPMLEVIAIGMNVTLSDLLESI